MSSTYSPPPSMSQESAIGLVRQRCQLRRCAACVTRRVCTLSLERTGEEACEVACAGDFCAAATESELVQL
ncbi:hypothetical protein LOC68_09920 [Blastopirellula sp. JC732]|uniref:Uncharacterized protein n=1 Tax=Blastopirellula sediminis TaxID=2894196 RepID=A0A9X1MM00_9BACT|nr:hypothetical protein [Blastopirellula sediminis]MCC9608508.1 hypothetical protein [Blastopirellula sediminis]MCC9628715.1 hypothetical protein [Blastopirellula sediminis]